MIGLDVLLFAFIGGLGAYYLTRLLRVLPVLRDLVEDGVKPIACNICMAFWASCLSGLVGYFAFDRQPLELLASAAIALWLLEHDGPSGPPRLPGLPSAGDA